MDGWKTIFLSWWLIVSDHVSFREGTWNQTGVWCNFDSQFQPAGQQAWQPSLGFSLQLASPVWFLFQGPMENSTFEVGIIWGICQKTKFLSHRVLYLGLIERLPRFYTTKCSFASVLIDKGAKLKNPNRRSIWHSCLLVCVFLCFALMTNGKPQGTGLWCF